MNIPYGYCHCGCGGKTRIATDSSKQSGHVKGEPIKYIRYHKALVSPIDRVLKRVEVNPQTQCWEWQGSLSNGYGNINMGRGKANTLVQWVTYEYFIGPIPDGLHVLHRCDNRICCNPYHLFLGTNLDNIADRVSKGRTTCGEVHYASKLTEGQVLTVLRGQGTPSEYSKRFGVSPRTIRDVMNRVSWKHVEVPHV